MSLLKKFLPFAIVAGYVLWLSLFFLSTSFQSREVFGYTLTTFMTLRVLPILGCLGLVVSLFLKKWKLAFFSAVLIFSFWLSLLVANLSTLF